MKVRIILIFFMFTLAILFGWKVLAAEEAPEQVPDFSLTDFRGKNFTLFDELKNNKAILLWFTNLCAGCRVKIPEIEKIKDSYKKREIEVAAISVLGKDRDAIEEVMRKNMVTFRILYDPDGKVTELFSGRHSTRICPLKNIFIIQKDKKLVYAGRYPGTEESEIINQLNESLRRCP